MLLVWKILKSRKRVFLFSLVSYTIGTKKTKVMKKEVIVLFINTEKEESSTQNGIKEPVCSTDKTALKKPQEIWRIVKE